MIAKRGKPAGKGMLTDIRNKWEKVTKGVQSQAVDLRDKVVDAGTQLVDKGKEAVASVTAKPTKVSAKVRGILKKMGDIPIKSATIVRSPVQSVVQQAINFVSGGEFKKAIADQPYDTIFHLMIVMTLEDGSSWSLEKNAIITLRPTKGRSGESSPVSVPSGFTLNKGLEKTAEAMGEAYATYSARDNNCQDFILSFLKSNGMGDAKDYTFVKQDVKTLFGKTDFLRKFTNTVTDIGAKVTTLIEGEGTKSQGKVMNAWIKFVKSEAERKGISYRDALRSPETKAGYKKGGMCGEEEHAMPDGSCMEGKVHKRVRKGKGAPTMDSSQAMVAQVEQVRDLAPVVLSEEVKVRKPRVRKTVM